MKSISLLIFLALSFDAMASECLSDYSRSEYPHWSKSKNFKDIRQEVIARAVVSGLVVESGVVVSGNWFDHFTGQIYSLDKVKPDVDHLVSLAWAHDRGGSCMSKCERKLLANDPLNLWPVHPSSNRQKGANVTGWMPSNIGICKKYLSRLKLVVEKYDLTLKKDDIIQYNRMVKQCLKWQKGIFINKDESFIKSILKK